MRVIVLTLACCALCIPSVSLSAPWYEGGHVGADGVHYVRPTQPLPPLPANQPHRPAAGKTTGKAQAARSGARRHAPRRHTVKRATTHRSTSRHKRKAVHHTGRKYRQHPHTASRLHPAAPPKQVIGKTARRKPVSRHR